MSQSVKIQSDEQSLTINVQADPLLLSNQLETTVSVANGDNELFVHTDIPHAMETLLDTPSFEMTKALCGHKRNGRNYTEYAQTLQEAAQYDAVYYLKGYIPIENNVLERLFTEGVDNE